MDCAHKSGWVQGKPWDARALPAIGRCSPETRAGAAESESGSVEVAAPPPSPCRRSELAIPTSERRAFRAGGTRPAALNRGVRHPLENRNAAIAASPQAEWPRSRAPGGGPQAVPVRKTGSTSQSRPAFAATLTAGRTVAPVADAGPRPTAVE